MKGLLGISLFAILTAVPMVANAADGEPVAGDPGATAESAVVASSAAGYPLALQDSDKDGKLVTGAYVKGAYNAAIKAINRVASDTVTALSYTTTALNSKQDKINDIDTIRTQAAAGAGAANNIGTMGDLQGGATLVEAINAVKQTADSALTSASLNSYATKQEVTSAINSATASGTIDVLTTWGTDAESSITISGNVSAAN